MNARPSTRWRRRLKIALPIGAGVATLTLVALWLSFQHIPAWYRPARLDEEGVRRAQRTAAAAIDSTSAQLVKRQPFEVVLEDATVNEWIAALPESVPELTESVPPEWDGFAVSFDHQRIQIAAHYHKDGWEAIVSLALSVRVEEDGSTIQVGLDAIQGGSLPVPRLVLNRLLSPMWEAARSRRSDDPASSALLSAIRSAGSIDALFDGVELKNRFVWPNGDRPLRIDSVRIDGGKLTLKLTPL